MIQQLDGTKFSLRRFQRDIKKNSRNTETLYTVGYTKGDDITKLSVYVNVIGA